MSHEPAPRVVKVFLASPSDVIEERGILARLVRDINDVLRFLAPEKRLSIELLRYETDTYPDLGAPQEVINRQIPLDYDIFIGVMWRRCGTPTETALSGTVEEFRRAYEKRKQGSLPRIMFYFCEQAIPIPDAEELQQLSRLVAFRDEISSMGLTWTYPSHAEFGEYVRSGLLRAIRDILLQDSPSLELHAQDLASEADPAAEQVIVELAKQYEAVRRDMDAGALRTRRMAEIFSGMLAKAAGLLPLLPHFEQSSSPGRRLAAVAILQMFPHIDHVDWLAGRLDPEAEKPFLSYQAAVALAEAVRALPVSHCTRVKIALEHATELAQRLANAADRINILNGARAELENKCSPAGLHR